LGGDGIASGLALCVTEAGSPKLFFSKACGIGLITIDNRQAGDLSKPSPQGTSTVGAGPLLAPPKEWQAHDQ
jgi:hypothetical protein